MQGLSCYYPTTTTPKNPNPTDTQSCTTNTHFPLFCIFLKSKKEANHLDKMERRSWLSYLLLLWVQQNSLPFSLQTKWFNWCQLRSSCFIRTAPAICICKRPFIFWSLWKLLFISFFLNSWLCLFSRSFTRKQQGNTFSLNWNRVIWLAPMSRTMRTASTDHSDSNWVKQQVKIIFK